MASVQRIKTGWKVRWHQEDRHPARHFKTKEEADRFAVTIEADVLRGEAPSLDRATVADMVAGFLENTDVKASTLARYGEHARCHVLPKLGKVKVVEIDHQRIERWQRELLAEVSRSTVMGARTVLNGALKRGVILRAIKSNPMTTVRSPKREKVERAFLTREQLHRLILAAGPHGLLIEFLAAVGARISEVAKLNHGDIDLGRRVVKFYSPQGKTTASKRDVRLSEKLVAKLATVVNSETPDAPLFVSPTGKARLNRRNFLMRVFKPAAERAGLGDIEGLTVHSLRHTSAALLLAEGMPLWKVSKRLGHESIQITMDHYGHLVPDDDSHDDILELAV